MFLALKNSQEKNQYLFFNSILVSEQLLRAKEWRENEYSVKMVIGSADTKLEYYSRYERDVEKALKEEFNQVGSTLKPLIYKSLEELGVKLTDNISVSPMTLNLKSGDWTPRESHKIEESEVTVERALKESLNIPVIRLSKSVGFDKVEKKLAKIFPRLLTPLEEYPAQLLGALELSTNELFEAYKNFFSKDCVQGNTMSVTSVLSDPNETTVKHRVGKLLGSQRFFGKTGTSNQGLDNWFVGFDGRELFVIWFGVDGDRSKAQSSKNYGSNTSFLIYRDSVLYSGKRLGILPCL